MKNFKKLSISIGIYLISIISFGQIKDSTNYIDFTRKIISDPTSNFYYPRLIEKATQTPKLISSEDCFYLYYGQIFQDDYKPLSFVANPEREEFDRAVMNRNYKKVYNIGIVILERNPVDLTVLLHTCNSIKEKGIIDTTYFFEQRLQNLQTAIMTTGDGKTINTAIGTVNAEDEYVMKGFLGFLGGEQRIAGQNNRFYSIWENEGQKLYFETIMTIKTKN